MGDTADNNVTDLGLARPFEMAAVRYLNAGWWPIPMPYGDKHPPPTGYTGRHSQWPDEDQIAEWAAEGNHNIAFHLGPVPPPRERGYSSRSDDWTVKEWLDADGEPLYIVVGIDVDHYSDGDKEKRGGDQLKELEAKLGALPETWTSSARQDGVSGIRYFLAPAKYGFKGKAHKDIDVIQVAHRYAMCWPSKHPKGGQYTWFRPGQAPVGQGATGFVHRVVGKKNSKGLSRLRFVPQDIVPTVWELPLLPDPWIEEITNGFTLHEGSSIDMDSSVDQVWDWAQESFKNDPGEPEDGEDPEEVLARVGCALIRKKVDTWKEQIDEDATSHDKITEAHWNILAMGQEGHAGWMAAMLTVENHWMHDVGSRGKRGLGEARNEIFRSRTNALRKLKAQVDEGRRGTGMTCGCYTPPPMEPTDEFTPRGEPKDPGDYTMDDDGNGEHLIDVFGGPGGDLRYVEGYETWLLWDGQRWNVDKHGLSARCFQVVKRRQINYVDHLWLTYANLAASGDEEQAKVYKGLASKWESFAQKSGNVGPTNAALTKARVIKGVSYDSGVMDGNESLLGVANGVIELHARHRVNGVETVPEVAYRFRPAEREDWVVRNTGIPYIPLSEQMQAGGDLALGVKLWVEFLEMFLPDPEIRAWVQQVMGHAIYGKNIAKQLVFLYGTTNTGKSTFLDVVMKAMGEYAGPFELSLFDNSSRFNTTLVQSLKRRIITTTEIAGAKNLSPEMMKRMTGNDVMSSEVKNEMTTVEGVPAFVPIFGTNSAPNVEANDPALQDRVIVLPFDVQAPKSSAGGALLEYSATAVLAWLVEGWAMYVQNDMRNKPGAKLSASESEFRDDMSGPAGQFMADCVERTGDPEDMILPDELYDVYEKWAETQRIEHKWPKNQFSTQVTRAGVDPTKVTRDARFSPDGKPVKVRKGIKLKESALKLRTFKVRNIGS